MRISDWSSDVCSSDLPDLGALCLSGLAAGPADAHALLHPYLHWRAEHRGGEGAARELCDLILHAQGRIERIVARFAPACSCATSQPSCCWLLRSSPVGWLGSFGHARRPLSTEESRVGKECDSTVQTR